MHDDLFYCWPEPMVASWEYLEWKILWFLAALLIALMIRSPDTKLRRYVLETATWLLPTWYISSDLAWIMGRAFELGFLSAPWLFLPY